jgi:hypothetical protein
MAITGTIGTFFGIAGRKTAKKYWTIGAAGIADRQKNML